MKPDPQFTKRTADCYRDMTKRAKQSLPFDLSELRAWVQSKLERPLCGYCGAALTAETWGFDHMTPVSRGGSWSLSNAQLVCKGCNKSKGDLTDSEYRILLSKLDDLERESRNFTIKGRVLGALRISQSFRQGAMRRSRKG
jgi:5-methylcytosine-specific restriction endonuclease McrA